MTWFRRKQSESEELCVEEVLRQEIFRLGLTLDVPDITRSTSSTSTLSSNDASCESWLLPEPHAVRVDSSQTFRGQHVTNSFLDILKGIAKAVDDKEQNFLEHDAQRTIVDLSMCCPQPCDDFSYERKMVCSGSRAQNLGPCESFHASEAVDDSYEHDGESSPSFSWRTAAMQTYPKTSFRTSRFGSSDRSFGSVQCSSERSVSFSPEIHVLEYERDMVHYSSPEWSQYFS